MFQAKAAGEGVFQSSQHSAGDLGTVPFDTALGEPPERRGSGTLLQSQDATVTRQEPLQLGLAGKQGPSPDMGPDRTACEPGW